MRRPPRIALLIAVLAALALWIALDEAPQRRAQVGDAGVHPAAPAREGASRMASPAAGAPTISARAPLPDLGADPFAAQSWEPPPPPPAPPRAVAPSAPPLPYRFAGRLYQDGVLQVLLDKGSSVLMAKQGDTIEGQYRVEALGDKELTLVYLPMGIAHRIQLSPLMQETESTAEAPPAPSKPERPASARLGVGKTL